MNSEAKIVVIDQEGVQGFLESSPEGGEEEICWIELEGSRRVQVPGQLLVPQKNGSYHLPLSLSKLMRQQKTSDEPTIIPVVEEKVVIAKEEKITGRVRIEKHVYEETAVVEEPVTHEQVDVERVPVNRPVESASGIRQEGDTTIIPVYEEVLVVKKQLVLKEEIRVTRRSTTHRDQQEITLRGEEVIVEREEEEG